MAIVLTVAQQKGGAGKTTLAANLATALLGHNGNGDGGGVALLDIDPQGSLGRWHAIRSARTDGRGALTFSDAAGWRLQAELERLRKGHGFVVIDSPPQVDNDARRAVRSADLVIVPVQPSPPDLWAAEGTLKLARDEKRRAVLLLNRVPPGGRLREQMAAAMAEMDVLAPGLGNRTAFAQAFAEGLGVVEAAPRSVAAAEMRAVVAAVLAAVGGATAG